MTYTAGSYIKAGLPNITGDMNGAVTGQGLMASLATGAFELDDGEKYRAWEQGPSNSRSTDRTFRFNANLSNEIYGNSTTVQPKSVVCQYLIKY